MAIPTLDKSPQIVPAGARVMSRPGGPAGNLPIGPASGMNIRDVLVMLRRRKWLIVLVTSIAMAVTLSGTLLWRIYAPFYAATAYIQVNPPERTELENIPLAASKDEMDRNVLSRAQLVKIDVILSQAAADPAMQRTKWYQDHRDKIIQELDDEIGVGAVPNTNLIRLSLSEPAPTEEERADLAEIVNAVAMAFVTHINQSNSNDMLERVNVLKQEADSLKTQLEAVQRDRAELPPADIPDIQEKENVLTTELQEKRKEMGELKKDLDAAKNYLASIEERAQAGQLASHPAVMQYIDQTDEMDDMRRAEVNLVTQIDDQKTRLGDDNRQVSSLENRLASIRRQIDEKREQLAQKFGGSLLSQARGQVEGMSKDMSDAQAEFDTMMKRLAEAEKLLGRIQALDREEQRLQLVSDDVTRSLRDSQLVMRHQKERQVELQVPATKPRQPSAPRWRIMVPLGIVAGLGIAVGLAFLLEFMDTSVKSPSDISRRIDLPVLGMVPHVLDINEEFDDLRLAFLTKPASVIGESFRQIRTCLMFAAPESRRRSLLVTSSLPGDGRGTIAMNLAGAMARAGRRVLVLDANFRQPMMRDLFPQTPAGGLSAVLAGKTTWTEQVQQVADHLDVMACGESPANPSELLDSETMRTTLDEMIKCYDHVLIKSPPILVFTDAAVLASLVDGVVLVARAGANSYGIVQRARDLLARVDARILGVVVNGVRVTAGGYFRRSYETFYDYHETSPRKLTTNGNGDGNGNGNSNHHAEPAEATEA